MGEAVEADWDAVRRDVEEGRGSQIEIAARHGVHPTTLAMRKLRGGWVSLRDIERWAKRDAAIDGLIDTLTMRLKRHARTSAKLAEEAKALAAGPCDAADLEARCEMSAKAGRDLSTTLSMAATVQRMAERRREDNARFAFQTQENPLERPEYLAVERAILARLAAAGPGGGVADVERGGAQAAGRLLGVAPDGAADAAGG